MANKTPRKNRGSMAGSVAHGFHEGSRSEYLAQFVFSSFGTSIPVPHQEDSGIDLYCTLLEKIGKRSWPRAYYSVQVKSTMEPWIFDSPESVRWIIEHPLPIFLCVVEKKTATINVYHTAPRFYAWALPIHRDRLELIPGTKAKAHTIEWQEGDTFNLGAPILSFTIQDVLDSDRRTQVADVLKFWIDYDVENLFRIKSGIQRFRVPHDYETNSTKLTGWSEQGQMRFSEDSLRIARSRLKELLGHFATQSYLRHDLVSAGVYAMALRHLVPDYETFTPHDPVLHAELDRRFGMNPSDYLFQACDALLTMVKGIIGHAYHRPEEPSASATNPPETGYDP